MSNVATKPDSTARSFTIAVAGNPNSGKTTLFNALTGATQKVGNYPGVTVEKKEGIRRHRGHAFHIVDLPGTYSLNTFSLDEVVARNYILDERPDIVIDVVDASNLERNLYLAIQLAEIGVPMVIALNMHDVAEKRGIAIDVDKLSGALGIPVVPTVGHRHDSAEKLLNVIADVALGVRQSKPAHLLYGENVEAAIADLLVLLEIDRRIGAHEQNRWLAIKLLEQDEKVCQRVGRVADDADAIFAFVRETCREIEDRLDEDLPMLIAEQRYAHASELIRSVVSTGPEQETLTDKLDKLLCHRVFGLVAVAAVIYFTFALTFKLADGWAYIPWFGEWQTPISVCAWLFDDFLTSLFGWLPEGPLRSLVVDGIIAGVGGVLSFVPIIFFMFLLLAVIEDSGYVARIAFVLDRLLRAFGLQGKSILALIVSGGIAGGCAVPGVMATRTLNDPKDRLTTMLVAPFMNCGAKIPVFAMLIAAFFASYQGLMMWILMLLAWTIALLAALTLRSSLIRGAESPFVMELPAYHLPTLGGVLRNAFARSWSYMRKAGTVILAVCIVMWALMYFPRADMAPLHAQEAALMETLQADAAGTPFAEWLTAANLDSTTSLYEAYAAASASDDAQSMQTIAAEAPAGQLALVQALLDEAPPARHLAAWMQADAMLQNQASRDQLRHSIAGRIGRTLEPISRYAGFDWRDNIALTGGFAAKEIIVSTMGTAYSMGSVEAVESVEENVSSNPLAQRISQDPDWSPLRAFSLMIFVMVYSPCLVTTSVIFRESGSWRWTLFSTLYTTILALVLATAVFQIGTALGIGIN